MADKTGRRRTWLVAGIAIMIAIGLAGCGSSKSDATSDVGKSHSIYPLTVTTNHGDVTIKKKPKRIVALSVANADELISLGAHPVAVAVDPATIKEGFPWMIDDLKGIADSSLITASYDLNVEAIAQAKPDLILAQSYQVKDKAIFDQLNKIAPTVAPNSNASNVDWNKRLLTTAAAIGRTKEAQALITQIGDEFAAIGKDVPDISSKTYQWVRVDPNGYGFGNGSVLELFGLKPASNQDNSQNDPVLSKEKTATLNADVLGVFPPTKDLRTSLDTDSLFQALPAVKHGTVFYADIALADAVNSPAPKALHWLKDRLKPTIEALAH